jgi:hypothetical protein
MFSSQFNLFLFHLHLRKCPTGIAARAPLHVRAQKAHAQQLNERATKKKLKQNYAKPPRTSKYMKDILDKDMLDRKLKLKGVGL